MIDKNFWMKASDAWSVELKGKDGAKPEEMKHIQDEEILPELDLNLEEVSEELEELLSDFSFDSME